MPQDPESHWATRGVVAWLRVPRLVKWIAVFTAVNFAISVGILTSDLAVRRITPRVLQGAAAACPVAGQHVPGASDGIGGCWPNGGNAGLPAGTSLTSWSGGCTLNTTNQVINAKNLKSACPDGMAVTATGVTITNSDISYIDVSQTASLTVSDSDFDAGNQLNFTGLGVYNFTATRIEVIGGQQSTQCAANCTIIDSYLHDQRDPPGTTPHNNAFITNGGSGMVLRHNTLWCSPTANDVDGGCSADLSLFGDFEAVNDVLVEKNLFHSTPSGAYCTYGGSASGKPSPMRRTSATRTTASRRGRVVSAVCSAL